MNTQAERKNGEGAEVIRVAIVDDHPVTRYGIEAVLSAVPEMTVVCSVGSVPELASELPADVPIDVIILDLYLDGQPPALAAITELSATTRVLIMSASGKPTDVVSAVRAGASGYLTKLSDRELIISTVEAVAAGGFLLSAELADIIQVELTHQPPSPRSETSHIPLSPREEETLGWIAKGFTHAQIATRMGIRKATVDTYVERIRAKLQVGNKAELTRAALERINTPEP